MITVTYRILPDLNPDTSYLDQPGFEERRAQFEAGYVNFVGVRAEVHVVDRTAGTSTCVTSAGLWGIESDSDGEWLLSVGREELASLTDELAARNIDITGIEPVLE